MEADTITLQELFAFKIDRVLPDGTVLGALRPTGLRPGFVAKFEKHGLELPSILFEHRLSSLAPGTDGGAQ